MGHTLLTYLEHQIPNLYPSQTPPKITISTRSKYHESVTIASNSIKEYATPTKIRLLPALNRSGRNKSFRQLQQNIPLHSELRYDGRNNVILGSPAFRRTRKLSIRLARPRKINPKTSRLLANPKRTQFKIKRLKSSYTIMASITVRTAQQSKFSQGRRSL